MAAKPMKAMTFRFDADHAEILEAIAAFNGVTMTEQMRLVVADFINKIEPDDLDRTLSERLERGKAALMRLRAVKSQ